MNIFENLLGSELLNEETRKQLTEDITKLIAEAKEEATVAAKTEFAELFIKEKNQLIEALDSKTTQVLETELKEFKEDIQKFRDLEVEYAGRLLEAKEEIQTKAKSDLKELVETIDSFLDVVLTENFNELKEDINECKKIRFGAQIFEAVTKTYEHKFANKDDLTKSLNEANEKLEETNKQLAETTALLKKAKREEKLAQVLENVNGRTKELMEVILVNVDTDKLEETYNRYITKVMSDSIGASDNKPSEKDTKVLAENTQTTKEVVVEGKVVTGNDTTVEPKKTLEEGKVEEEEWVKRLKKLSGQ